MLKCFFNGTLRSGALLSVLLIPMLVTWSSTQAGSGDKKTPSVPDTIKVDLSPAPEPAKSTSGREVAPDFALRDINGKTVKLSDYKGHVVLVDFWATWCPPCRASIPDLVATYDSCHAAGFDILGITFERGGPAALPGFVTQNKIRYPVLIGDRTVSASYGNVNALPTSVLVGRDGTIREQWVGLQGTGVIGKSVRELLKEKKPK